MLFRSRPPTTLSGYSVADQPGALDEAALSFCIADAFHPGCELTWPMRRRSLYTSFLRLRRRTEPERDYSAVLTPAIALGNTGPLNESGPGDLTRWLAVPWQTDTANCRWSYDEFRTTEHLPSFWPATVPNEVLSEADYRTALDTSKSIEERRSAFLNRTEIGRAHV